MSRPLAFGDCLSKTPWLPNGLKSSREDVQYEKLQPETESFVGTESHDPHQSPPEVARSGFYRITTAILAIALVTLAIVHFGPMLRMSSSSPNEMHTCGNTTEEAKARGCTFDLLAKAWLPPSCERHGLEEFIAAGSKYANDGSNGTWPYYHRKGGGRQMSLEELADLGDNTINGTRWWSTSREHTVHCGWMLLRMANAYTNGIRGDHLTQQYKHARHCVHTMMDKAMQAPDLDEIITVGNVVLGTC